MARGVPTPRGGRWHPQTVTRVMDRVSNGRSPKRKFIVRNGSLDVEVLNTAVTLDKEKPNSVFHPGGTAVVIHAGRDDYTSDPAGKAGERIACGVVAQWRATNCLLLRGPGRDVAAPPGERPRAEVGRGGSDARKLTQEELADRAG